MEKPPEDVRPSSAVEVYKEKLKTNLFGFALIHFSISLMFYSALMLWTVSPSLHVCMEAIIVISVFAIIFIVICLFISFEVLLGGL